jgi:hypothetical protein
VVPNIWKTLKNIKVKCHWKLKVRVALPNRVRSVWTYTQVNMMFLIPLWVYIHIAGKAWKICLATLGIEHTTFGTLAQCSANLVTGQVISSMWYFGTESSSFQYEYNLAIDIMIFSVLVLCTQLNTVEYDCLWCYSDVSQTA